MIMPASLTESSDVTVSLPANAKILSGESKLLKSPISATIIAPIRRLMPGIVVIGESILSIMDFDLFFLYM